MQMDTAGIRVALLALQRSWPHRSPEDTAGLASGRWPLEEKKKKGSIYSRGLEGLCLGQNKGNRVWCVDR